METLWCCLFDLSSFHQVEFPGILQETGFAISYRSIFVGVAAEAAGHCSGVGARH